MLNHSLLKSYIQEKSNDLIVVRMFVAFGFAIFTVTPALFLKAQGFSDSVIGIIMAATALTSLVISIISTIALEKINEYKIFLLSIFIPLVFLLLLVFYPFVSVYILFLTVSAIFTSVRKNSFSIMLKDITQKGDFTKKESLMYSFVNIGWFVGPFIGGLLIDSYGFIEVFALAALFYFVALLISVMLKIKLKKKDRKKIDSNIIKNIKSFVQRKELVKSFFLAFSSNVWYVLIFIFIPLFIVEANVRVVWVGIFLAATQLPLIVIQLKLNWFVERCGIQKLLMYSYSYLALVTVILFFHSEIYFTMALLSTTAFALAFIEPLREIYFFKNVKTIDEEKTYPIYNTSFSIGSIFGKLLFAGILLILPNNFLYITMSLLMATTVVLTHNLKDYRE